MNAFDEPATRMGRAFLFLVALCAAAFLYKCWNERLMRLEYARQSAAQERIADSLERVK